MRGISVPDSIFDALASLRLAVVTMLTLGATCAYATFYQMDHGTEGLDSNLALFEGETTDRVTLLERSLQVALPDPAAQGYFPIRLREARRLPAPRSASRSPIRK